MIGFLRFIGVVNAAVWFGAAVFFTFGAAPGFFSPEMTSVVTPPYNGWAAQVIVKRYFTFQNWCGAIALLHILVEKLYAGRMLSRLALGVFIGIFSLGLIGGFWLQPRMHQLFLDKNNKKATVEQQEAAAKSFGMWHGVSQAANLVMLSGLLFYFWRISTAKEPSRTSSDYRKFSVGWQ